MIVQDQKDIEGLKKSGSICAYIRDSVASYLSPGMSTLDVDNYAGSLFANTGFISAPRQIYNFPGNICLSVNSCVAHGVPSKKIVLKDGDSVNVDVCGSYDGYFTDTGMSVVIGENPQRKQVCDCAKAMLIGGLEKVKKDAPFKEMGKEMQSICKEWGFSPIKKLSGHGIGRSLHEKPKHIHCNYMPWDTRRFPNNMTVAIETFVSSSNGIVLIGNDNWSWICPGNAMSAQFEHTIIVTEDKPIILTEQR